MSSWLWILLSTPFAALLGMALFIYTPGIFRWVILAIPVLAIAGASLYSYNSGVEKGRWLAAQAEAECRVALANQKTELAQDHEVAARAREQAALTALAELREAQARGDELTRQLAENDKSRKNDLRKFQNALHKLAAGRSCLNHPTIRLLDNAIGIQSGVSETAGRTDAAHAGAIATDTQVAGWIAVAGSQYAECVDRYHRLIDWHEVKK